jgi:hypothetical protein
VDLSDFAVCGTLAGRGCGGHCRALRVGQRGLEAVGGLLVTPFQGVLALFLLELGTVAGRRLGDWRKVGPFLLGFGVVMPVLHAVAGVAVGHAVGLRVVVPPPVAEQLLRRLEIEFFPRFGIIADESDVRVLRPEKF